ncbi:PREDICTED: NKG2D ligand 4-like [Condylura cristata]|uniref:NKG2D ligand 4-like n=1 Tax=Condylura cristata TaxID=143302 RepID=UPI000643B8F6|nr:PREDICTED: NKG2D ligand 4-like [Condylura cristata]
MAGPSTLQAMLSCQCEAQRGTGASWEFSLNGQTTLLFDAVNGKWSAVGPGASEVKYKLESNSDYFRRISKGDCSQWLGEFLPHWEGMLEPTAPPTKSPETKQSNRDISRILIPLLSVAFIVIVIIIISITIAIIRKRRAPAPRASPTTARDTENSKAASLSHMPFLGPVILHSCSIVLSILGSP